MELLIRPHPFTVQQAAWLASAPRPRKVRFVGRPGTQLRD